IHGRDAVHAANRAERGARLGRREFASNVVHGVGFQRHTRIAALLRAVVDEAVLADVEIPPARAAAPRIWFAIRQVLLEAADARVQILQHLTGTVDRGSDLVEHFALGRRQWLQTPAAVVDDADGRGEAELARPRVDRPRVLGILDAASEHRV